MMMDMPETPHICIDPKKNDKKTKIMQKKNNDLIPFLEQLPQLYVK